MNVESPDWSPMADSLQEPFAQTRRFSSFRAYHDEGYVDPSEKVSDSRLIGLSVWNTKRVLIIPGQASLADPDEGLQRFIYGGMVNGQRDGNGVKDIKIYFQTYSISGDLTMNAPTITTLIQTDARNTGVALARCRRRVVRVLNGPKLRKVLDCGRPLPLFGKRFRILGAPMRPRAGALQNAAATVSALTLACLMFLAVNVSAGVPQAMCV